MSIGIQSRREARVLVIDDEPQMVKVIEGVLGILGVGSVATAEDGRKALGLVKGSATPFDLVI